ncbi:OmpH family outer membrane protein [Sphingorhabdus sp. Alg239-R122]|uniref:OmpH family outer membrane protein n=1 Tax=Sphingorhabdus sp. Alg239-R122 TaxID=2305989 RepID=UPI0019686634|nr:OmpH family outer membrane protein [Sphingorhabdus sp. Alg239-R122]
MIKTFACASALALAGGSVALVPAASAQSRQAMATAQVQSALVQSNAYRAAEQQINTAYAADIQQTQTRATALDAEMKPFVDAYNAAASQPGATQESIRPQAQALQQKRAAGQQELSRLQSRVSLARTYVIEQIDMRLADAVRAAMKAQKVDMLISPEAIIAREPYVDITPAIVAQLNTLVPSVNAIPPAGYQPGSIRAAAQQQQQQQQQPAPSGR